MGYMTTTRDAWDDFQEEVGKWATSVFTQATPVTIVTHLLREVCELGKDATGEELADCVLLLMHYAHRKGLSIYDECQKKFEINKARKWGKPDAEGVQEHLRPRRKVKRGRGR